MRHASLFSGIGGFDLAAEFMGWENVFHCEINPWCQKVLKYHFPNSKQYDDITKTDFSCWKGEIDILTGGFPCQPFSVAGSRKGKDDDRYLWPEMLRAIREVQPGWVVGENVAGILSMVQPSNEITVESQASLFETSDKETILEQEYVIETVCRDLEREGYTVQPVVIPACSVGAPHRRDRVWFIANRTNSRIENLQKWQNCICGFESPSYASSERLERYINCGRQKNERRENLFWINSAGFGKKSDWEDFPTQPPICSRDDGVSSRLDGISFCRWREESIKAYGNAIVPQVAFEIYKVIQTINQL